MIEKRKMHRFAIAVPAIVRPRNDDSRSAPLNLVCRDVSAAGAFFLTSDALDVGTRVQVVMFLELGDGAQQAAVKARVSVSGIVNRVEKQGMAVCFEKKYKMVPASQCSQSTDLCQEALR